MWLNYQQHLQRDDAMHEHSAVCNLLAFVHLVPNLGNLLGYTEAYLAADSKRLARGNCLLALSLAGEMPVKRSFSPGHSNHWGGKGGSIATPSVKERAPAVHCCEATSGLQLLPD